MLRELKTRKDTIRLPADCLDEVRDKLLRHRSVTEGGCWEWQMARNAYGYGVWGFRGQTYLVHRLSVLVFLGADASTQMCVLHRCDNPACFNPSHLWLGTKSENSQDMARKGRSAKGSRHGMAKLCENDVREIHLMLKRGENTSLVASRFRVSPAMIRFIRAGKNWGHVIAG